MKIHDIFASPFCSRTCYCSLFLFTVSLVIWMSQTELSTW